MQGNPNSFFVTKLAKKEDKIIDPGEAAAAGLAIAAGPVSSTVIPTIGGVLARKLGPEPAEHTGAPIRGKTIWGMTEGQLPIEGSLKTKILSLLGRGPAFEKTPIGPMPQLSKKSKIGLEDLNNQTYKILNLFDVKQSPKPWYKTLSSKSLAEAGESWEAIDSMIFKNKLPQKGVSLEFTSGPYSRLMGPYYDPTTKKVTLPWTNKSYALHELGHAAHLTKPGARAFDMMRTLIHGGASMAIPMAYIAGNEMKEMIPGKLDDKVINFVQKHSPAILASTWAGASIYPEVQATTRAVSHIYKTEGRKAAVKTLKELLPALSTYLIPVIPAVVGLSLAKKYFYEAQEKNKEQKKEAGLVKDFWDLVSSIGAESSHVAGQIAMQTSNMLKTPGTQLARNVFEAGKKNIKSPEFAYGAVMSGIPALVSTYVIHNTPEGKIYAERERELASKKHKNPILDAQLEIEKLRGKKKEDSLTFPAIVGLGAAISGGFLTKFFSDLTRAI